MKKFNFKNGGTSEIRTHVSEGPEYTSTIIVYFNNYVNRKKTKNTHNNLIY